MDITCGGDSIPVASRIATYRSVWLLDGLYSSIFTVLEIWAGDPKRDGSDCVDWATSNCLFTGAFPLLPNAGNFACCVSTLGLYVPHYRTRYIANSFTKTMLTLSLARTPDRHRQLTDSGPELKPFASLACK